MTDPVVVGGTISLSNGQPPPIYTMGGGMMPREAGNIQYRCQILGEHILVEFPDGVPHSDVDEVFRISRQLVESTILSRVVTEGIGLSFRLDYCRTSAGDISLAEPDRAPAAQPDLDRAGVNVLIGVLPNLRYAVRDFNQGLLYREDSPLYFYRVVETLAKLLCQKDEGLTRADWTAFHGNLGTSRDDVDELEALNRQHRHGTHDEFTAAQHRTMALTARGFLARAIAFLADHPEYVPEHVRDFAVSQLSSKDPQK